MHDIEETFERQSAWQRSLRLLPWAVKLRMVEATRDAVKHLRGEVSPPAQSRGSSGDKP